MKVLILAAGRGTRLGELTVSCPKPLVSLFGTPLLVQQIANFNQVGLNQIALVTGYQHKAFEPFGLQSFFNPDYAFTNMLISLMAAKEYLDGKEDVIVCYGDILTEPHVIKSLMGSEEDIALCSDLGWYEYWIKRTDDIFSDIESFQVDRNDYVLTLGQKVTDLKDVMGQYIGMFKLKAGSQARVIEHFNILKNEIPTKVKSMYMTDFLQYLIHQGEAIKAVFHKRGWLELDTLEDKACYEDLFQKGEIQELGYKVVSKPTK